MDLSPLSLSQKPVLHGHFAALIAFLRNHINHNQDKAVAITPAEELRRHFKVLCGSIDRESYQNSQHSQSGR